MMVPPQKQLQAGNSIAIFAYARCAYCYVLPALILDICVMQVFRMFDMDGSGGVGVQV